MSDLEVKKFEKNKNYENAIKLRKFDEDAKQKNIKIKNIKDYIDVIKFKKLYEIRLCYYWWRFSWVCSC